MKKLDSLMASVTALSLLLVPFSTPLLQASPPARTATPYVSPWPRAFDRNGAHVIVYQPQVKSWRGYRSLIADTAYPSATPSPFSASFPGTPTPSPT